MQPNGYFQQGYAAYGQPQQPAAYYQQQQYAQPPQQWQQPQTWPQLQPSGLLPQQQPPQAWGPPVYNQAAQYQTQAQQVTPQQPPAQWAAPVAAAAGPLPPPQPAEQPYVLQPQQQHAPPGDLPPLPQDAAPPLPAMPQEAAPPLPPEAMPPLPPGPPLPAGLPQQQHEQQQPGAQYYPQQQQQQAGMIYAAQQQQQQAGAAYPPAQLQPGVPYTQQQHQAPQQQQQYAAAPAPQQSQAYLSAAQTTQQQQQAYPAQYPAQYAAQYQQQYAAQPSYQPGAAPAQQPTAYAGGWGYPQQAPQYAGQYAPPAAHYAQQHPPGAAYPAQPSAAAPYPHPAPAYPHPPVHPQAAPAVAPAAAQPIPQIQVDGLSLVTPGPGREGRPKRLAVLLRGLPGSGKSHVARLLRDKEVEAGGDAPRILSLDDYFMTEVEKEVEDEEGGPGGRRGRKRKVEVLEYQYEPDMEASYQRSLLKAFQRAAEESRYKFLVVDAPAIRVADIKDFWSAGQAAGYEVYVAEPAETDPQVCFQRNTHGRSKEDIYALSAQFEPTPGFYTALTLGPLLGRSAPSGAAAANDGIAEVDMDDDVAAPGGDTSAGDSASEDADSDADGGREASAAAKPAASRWAALDGDGSGGEGGRGGRSKKQKRGAGGSRDGLQSVDDWRELLAAGKAQLAAGGGTPSGRGTPRGILCKGSGGSGRKKRVRWPDQEFGGEDGEEEAEQGFRFGGGATTAKSGLEVVHLVHGLGPPQQLEDGTSGVMPHPSAPAGFAAAARAEHRSEADAFRSLLLGNRPA